MASLKTWVALSMTLAACSGGADMADPTPTSDAGTDAFRLPEIPALDDDAGAVDAPPPVDVPSVEDVPAAEDAPSPMDVPAAEDVPAAVDVPSTVDVPVSADVPVGSDVPVPTDSGAPCDEPPMCDAAPPTPSAIASWRHITTRITVALGSQRHRGRDLFLRQSDAQWGIARFTYGPADDDLVDEDVEVFLLRNCRTWERLGVARTTRDGDHPTIEGVVDNGGFVYFPIPASARLGVGRHRLRYVVRGDHTFADQYIEVLPDNAHVAVSDVDGTLTESETAEWLTVFGGASPAVNVGAPEALWALARRGYIIFYLTARPEWLTTRTHQWTRERGLPSGLVHTMMNLTGATGAPAFTFKRDELNALRTRLGHPVDYGFGNTDTDAQAYQAVGIPGSNAYYYRFTGDRRGGQLNNDYRTLVAPLSAGPRYCR
ncbi:MAG: phosphatidylinositol transfer protein [Myxococcaceae bacterium]|nr:MAG: phosphatidylinositol transfer protein [Myxococcaceae bacterium]